MGQRGPPSAGFGVRAVDDEEDGPPDWSAIMLPDYRPTAAQAQRQAAARAAGYQPVTDEEVWGGACNPPILTADVRAGPKKATGHLCIVVAVSLCAFLVPSESRSCDYDPNPRIQAREYQNMPQRLYTKRTRLLIGVEASVFAAGVFPSTRFIDMGTINYRGVEFRAPIVLTSLSQSLVGLYAVQLEGSVPGATLQQVTNVLQPVEETVVAWLSLTLDEYVLMSGLNPFPSVSRWRCHGQGLTLRPD
jgi:hypothetical protein